VNLVVEVGKLRKEITSFVMVFLILTSLLAVSGVAAQPSEKVAVILGFKNKPDAGLIRAHGGEIKYVYHIIQAIACSLPQKAIDALEKNPVIAYIERDYEVYAIDAELDNSWGVKRIGGGIVHGYNKGTGVMVAIIDTGIDYNHPDLDANYKGGIDYVNKDSDPMDDNGHGTHCAGIVAAEDNGGGVVGVAPKAGLYAVKVLNRKGSGAVSDVVAGIQWSIDNGMQVISMSLGSSSDSTSLRNACDMAYNSGIVLVAAAGNSGNTAGSGDNVLYPARYSSVIAVGATDKSDKRASWSSTGSALELAAPGVSIYSTYLGGAYATLSGTSMACPHVAGTAALVLASSIDSTYDVNNNGSWDASEVREKLKYTADDLGVAGWDSWYGYGLVDADEAAPAPSVDTTPPAQVTDVRVTTVSSSQLDVSWAVNVEPDLNHYKVYRSTSSGFMPSATNLIASPATNSYSDTGLTSSTTYYYRVSAVDTAGNEGAPSSEASGTTSEAPALTTMRVASIVMSLDGRTVGRNTFVWATATVTVVDAIGDPVVGATVYGHWEIATTDSDSGITDVSGQVSLQSDSVKNPPSGTTFKFVVDRVELSGWTYDPSANVETSDSITV